KGDAFYYAFNLDHFYRLPPQQLSSYVGTTLFRLNSHMAHFWETFFPVVVFGLIARWAVKASLPPISPLARRIASLAWIALGLVSLAIVVVAYPVHFVQPKGSWWTLERAQLVFSAGWLSLMVLIGWGWRRLRYRPFRPKVLGKERCIDLETFLAWTMGRRIWLAVGTIFHLHLVVM